LSVQSQAVRRHTKFAS